MSDTPWLSTEQIADYLGVKRDTIYKWRIRHGMPTHKVGKLWKFRKTEVDRWVTSGEASKRNEAAANATCLRYAVAHVMLAHACAEQTNLAPESTPHAHEPD